ncbi:hypothetical protein GCM10010103_37390 [Streptomyces paradoxus]
MALDASSDVPVVWEDHRRQRTGCGSGGCGGHVRDPGWRGGVEVPQGPGEAGGVGQPQGPGEAGGAGQPPGPGKARGVGHLKGPRETRGAGYVRVLAGPRGRHDAAT